MLVRNIRYAFKKDHNVYIGWGEKARNIARSPLSPPYEMRLLYRGPDSERENAERQAMMRAYKAWLWKKMQDDDPDVWNALKQITANSVLLCHCHPKACHGYVVRDAWTWAYKQGKITQPKPERTPRSKWDERPLHTPAPAVVVPVSPVLADARLDEQLLESNALHASLPPKKAQGRGAPRKPRTLNYGTPDPLYNRIDDLRSDLEELHALATTGEHPVGSPAWYDAHPAFAAAERAYDDGDLLVTIAA